jgi:asparagine synthase (glutamine-hydrolysing)
MCGIAGVVDVGGGPVVAADVAPMIDALRLRGPDDEGLFCDGVAALGHRRLSIIDLEGGHQPMADEAGRATVVFNGEIYNFVALRERLAGLGHRFRTRSDTEVIVRGYLAWGEAVVEQLDGMFAFALWDARARRLLLARDRFGKKPLYWSHGGGRFAFASTVTALLRHPAIPRRIDREALARYLALEYVPGPSSILDGVRKLEAGAALVLDGVEAGGRVRARRYFRLAVGERAGAGARAPKTIEEGARLVREHLVEATRRRLVADVPVGVFLSGGIDSSSVVAAAIAAGARRVRTFSIGFDEPSFDESDHARAVARHFGTDHVEEQCSVEQLLEIVPQLGDILDEPMADGSIIPTTMLSRLARRHVKVALGGDGGDELFAGYPTYAAHRLVAPLEPLVAAGVAGPLVTAAQRAAARLPVSHANLSFDFKVKRLLDGIAWPPAVRNAIWLGAFRPDELGELLGRPVDASALLAPVAAAYEEARGATHLERVLEQDVRFYLGHLVLTKVDRASMSSSLEVRAPFLDTALAELVAAMPLAWKISRLTGKVILRRAVRPWLPARVLGRPKKGFGMPIGAWLRGPLRELARDLLLGRDGLASTGLTDGAVVARLVDEHERGRVDHRKRLWALLVLELWRRAHRPET